MNITLFKEIIGKCKICGREEKLEEAEICGRKFMACELCACGSTPNSKDEELNKKIIQDNELWIKTL